MGGLIIDGKSNYAGFARDQRAAAGRIARLPSVPLDRGAAARIMLAC